MRWWCGDDEDIVMRRWGDEGEMMMRSWHDTWWGEDEDEMMKTMMQCLWGCLVFTRSSSHLHSSSVRNTELLLLLEDFQMNSVLMRRRNLWMVWIVTAGRDFWEYLEFWDSAEPRCWAALSNHNLPINRPHQKVSTSRDSSTSCLVHHCLNSDGWELRHGSEWLVHTSEDKISAGSLQPGSK